MNNCLHQIGTKSFLLFVFFCFTFFIPHQSFGALTDIAWIEDNPEGAAVTVQVWPSTTGQEDFLSDPTFGSLLATSPTGNWGFSSFTADHTLTPAGFLGVDVNGTLGLTGGSVPGPGEIPFSFSFSTTSIGIGTTEFFPISPLPQGIEVLTFAAQIGPDPHGGNDFVYGIGMGVGVSVVPIPAALPLFASALAGLGIIGWRRKKKVA